MFCKKTDEKIKTQVLNLDEVREAEANEKKIKHRKLPKKFLVIALILIVIGLLYLPAKDLIKKFEDEKRKINNDKNSITCTINDKSKDNHLIERTSIFNFKGDELKSYNILVTTTSAKTDGDSMKKFKSYYDDLNKKYKKASEEEGFKGTVEYKDKKIIETMNVDLEKYDGDDKIVSYKLDDSITEVKEKEKEDGAVCK